LKILLDTCTFLWIVEGSSRLSQQARELFSDPANEVFLSAVSAWEIVQKYALGKLPLPESPDRFITRYRSAHSVLPLPLDEDAVLHLSKLPGLHRDPFDRMLVCQAIAGSSIILTPDPLVAQYPVRVLW
jgi:PIN domain nuclease of toxin-antitoxin system